MSHVKCYRFSIVLVNTAVAIFRANVYWGFRKPYIVQAIVGDEWDVKDLFDRTEEWVGIQLAVSTWLREGGDEKIFRAM
jgi:hypothetical protein